MCQYAEEHPGSKQTEIGGVYLFSTPMRTLLTSCSNLWSRTKVGKLSGRLYCVLHTDHERSTVSKVLRQKDKFLTQDDGSRSPIKRAKGRSPDIERALAVWAKNQVRFLQLFNMEGLLKVHRRNVKVCH